MRQLLTRLDDDLHALLKERARREGTSVNAFVTRTLAAALATDDSRARLQQRLRERGRLASPVLPAGTVPGRHEVIEELRGAADVVLQTLAAGRAPR